MPAAEMGIESECSPAEQGEHHTCPGGACVDEGSAGLHDFKQEFAVRGCSGEYYLDSVIAKTSPAVLKCVLATIGSTSGPRERISLTAASLTAAEAPLGNLHP